MSSNVFEAYDRVAHALSLAQRLAETRLALAERGASPAELSWVEAAREALARASGEEAPALLTRSLRLAELEPLRVDLGRKIQSGVVQAVEALREPIVSSGGERSPLLEAIYWKLKPAAMQRSAPEDFEKFCVDVEKRLASSYVTRWLEDEAYAAVRPAVIALRAAIADWRVVFAGEPPTGARAEALREELVRTSARLEVPLRQSRLLAEAALLVAPDLIDASGIFDKPKRRAARLAAGEASPAEPDGEPEAPSPS